jgi:hypothetical protein
MKLNCLTFSPRSDSTAGMQSHSILPTSGSRIKVWAAGNYNLNELETICDVAIDHRGKWKKARSRKPRSCSSLGLWVSSREKDKIEYPTLVKALAAQSSMARKRGKRHKRLRPYRVGSSWLLTKMSKGQARNFPVCPR